MKTHLTTEAAKTEMDRPGTGAAHIPQAASSSVTDASAAPLTPHRYEQMANNSPRAMQLRQMAEMMAASPASVALRRHQQMANSSPQATQSQRHAEMMTNRASGAVTPPVQRQIGADVQREKRPGHTGLPDQLKSGIESLSGMSMDHVKVHYNSNKPAQLQAHAYAQGSDIHLAHGQEQHLPHEAWHVVQQAQGRVKPTLRINGGVSVNDDAGLEAEADSMGRQATGWQRTDTSNSLQSATLQRMVAGAGCIQRAALLRDPITFQTLLVFLRQVLAEESEVSVADQARIASYVERAPKSRNRAEYAQYLELEPAVQYAEGGVTYKKLYESSTKHVKKKRRTTKSPGAVAVEVFSDEDSEASDGELDIDKKYKKSAELYQQAVDHSDANGVKNVINPRNTNMLAFLGGSLIPSSINQQSNDSATPKSKKKLARKFRTLNDTLRSAQEQVYFGSHLRGGRDGGFEKSIESLKAKLRSGDLKADHVKPLVSRTRKGFSIANTEGHAEQSLLRSKTWDALKKRLIARLTALKERGLKKLEGEPDALLVTLILNRSSCRGCGLALSLALIEFWQEVAAAVGSKEGWEATKKRYGAHFRFVLRFPTVYEYDAEKSVSFLNLEEILSAVTSAGWEVAPVSTHIEGGKRSHEQLNSSLKKLGKFPKKEDLEFYKKPSKGKRERGTDRAMPHTPAVASGNRVATDALRAFLNGISPDWSTAFQNAAAQGVQTGLNQGYMAENIAPEHQAVAMPVTVALRDETQMLTQHRLQVSTNGGSAAQCFIYSVLMGLTGEPESAIHTMVNQIAHTVGAGGGWINSDSTTAVNVVAEIERLYGEQIDVVVLQQGTDGPIIAGRAGHLGGRTVIIRQTPNHYDAYVP